jgi:hypothetical protein
MGGECDTHARDRNVYRVLVGKPNERDHLNDLGIDGRITLKQSQENRM